jgi:hypothetical protein
LDNFLLSCDFLKHREQFDPDVRRHRGFIEVRL